MRLLAVLFLALFAQLAHARPAPSEPAPQLEDGTAVTAPFAAKARVDTTYIFGGPGSYEGSFETPGGQPDWHGWTSYDNSSMEENHWHTSTYWADHLDGHGPGNHALYCGDESFPSCAAWDTLGGSGNNWFDDAQWIQTVDDPSQPVTVRLTGIMTYDLFDETWDFLELFVQRSGEPEMLASWTGSIDTTVTIDFTTVMAPEDFTGPDGNEVQLFWRVHSDGAWSDEDCMAPSHGACQIDDLSVYFDDVLITFDDFEPGSPVNWNAENNLVGDFANLRNDLGNIDPCTDNNTWQVNFIDDGLVVPGTGGTPCIQWCYDPGGYIVNNTGGLMSGGPIDWYLDNLVLSPPIAYPAGHDGAQLDFGVYRHQPSSSPSDAGIFYRWFIRSADSSDPADLELAPWESRNVFYKGGPDFKRHEEPVSDLLVSNRQWVQIALSAVEGGYLFNIDGPDGAPAPYFDNVALKIWEPEGPDIQVPGNRMFGDAYPAAGFLDPTDLAANSCRVDMNGPTFGEVRGDSLVARIKSIRHDAVVVEDPVLHWVMACNPVFDSVRSEVPDGEGLLRGSTSGSGTVDSQGAPLVDHWTFDLPDEGFFFPGDRLRYYITASDDDQASNIRTSAWPPDTTGVTDFAITSGFPRELEIRGLPTVTQPTVGELVQPTILFVDESDNPQATEVWFQALEELDLVRGVDFDIVTVDRLGQEVRLDMTLSLGFFAGYQTMLYARGTQFAGTLASEDAQLINDWLSLGNKQALMAGDGVGGDLSGPPLANQMGIQFDDSNVFDLNGGLRELQVSPISGNGALPDDVVWQIYDGCPEVRITNAISATGEGQVSATLDPQGTTGGPFAALVTVDDQVLTNRTAVMPFGLDRVDGLTVGSAKDGPSFSPQAHLLNFLLFWLGTDTVTSVEDIPGIKAVTASAHPNPFNPQTTIAFELPAAMEVSLEIFDMQGRLVKNLLNRTPFTAGSHQQVWDGRDTEGRPTGSGVYFYKFVAGDQKQVGKLTLIK